MTGYAPVENAIRNNLGQFDPVHLEVRNESFRHNVPKDSESHFKVVVVSEAFRGKSLVVRHRMINTGLQEQLAGPVHALAIHAMTPEEWFEKGGEVSGSPECLGGTGL